MLSESVTGLGVALDSAATVCPVGDSGGATGSLDDENAESGADELGAGRADSGSGADDAVEPAPVAASVVIDGFISVRSGKSSTALAPGVLGALAAVGDEVADRVVASDAGTGGTFAACADG